jgi:hypothetical protein
MPTSTSRIRKNIESSSSVVNSPCFRFCSERVSVACRGASLERPPVGWRERDAPKIRSGSIELDGDVKSFRHLWRRTSDATRDALACLSVLEDEPSLRRQISLHHDKRTLATDSHRGDRQAGLLSLDGDMNVGANTKRDAPQTPRILENYGSPLFRTLGVRKGSEWTGGCEAMFVVRFGFVHGCGRQLLGVQIS